MPGKELVLIDTSVWIQADSLKANSEVKSKVLLLLDKDRAAACGIIIAELLCGAKTPTNYEELKIDIEGIHYLNTPENIWLKAAQMSFDLRKKGISIPLTDILIACIAIDNNCSLLHLDKHFTVLASKTDLKIELFE